MSTQALMVLPRPIGQCYVNKSSTTFPITFSIKAKPLVDCLRPNKVFDIFGLTILKTNTFIDRLYGGRAVAV